MLFDNNVRISCIDIDCDWCKYIINPFSNDMLLLFWFIAQLFLF